MSETPTTASDVIEGAMRMLDCGECAERLARLADQWRADEAAVLASVKPSREAVAQALGNARWGDQWLGVPDISLLRQADAILASDLLPGKTEAEVREQVAAEIEAAPVLDDFGKRRDAEMMRDLASRIARKGGQR